MRTYEETYERILSKKAIAEKEIKARNKRIITSISTVSCLGICLVALFAISKARVNINPDKNDMPDIYLNSSSNSNTGESTNNTNPNSTTLAEKSSTQISTQTDKYVEKPSVGEDGITTNHGESAGQNGDPTTFYTGFEGTHEYIDSPHLTDEEKENYRLMYVRCAMNFVDDEDYSKINIDKSYMKKVIKDVNGEKYLLIHLEGDTFYYEIVITTRCAEAHGVKKINK